MGARRTGRTVKWIASRSDVFLSDHAARDMWPKRRWRSMPRTVLVLRIVSIANLGVSMIGVGGSLLSNQYIHLQGSYRISAIGCCG